jgi:hypothetical protein
MSELVTTAKNSGTVRKRLLLIIIMFNSKSNVRLNEWFHQNKCPHQKLQVGCQLLDGKSLKSKGTFETARSHFCPMTGNAPIPAERRDC